MDTDSSTPQEQDSTIQQSIPMSSSPLKPNRSKRRKHLITSTIITIVIAYIASWVIGYGLLQNARHAYNETTTPHEEALEYSACPPEERDKIFSKRPPITPDFFWSIDIPAPNSHSPFVWDIYSMYVFVKQQTSGIKAETQAINACSFNTKIAARNDSNK
jgi:hypothetical protein